MNTNSIVDLLKQQLGPDAISTMSHHLGSDPSTTSSAISMAIPILLAGLARNAAKPQGASDLDSALNAHDGSVLDDLGGFLGNAAGGPGGGILGHILGGRRAPVEQGMGRATGMNAAQIGQLLVMLAPLVMGALGRMKRQKNLGPQQLPDVLTQEQTEIERQAPETAGLGRVLDMNNDGQIADDIARMGTSVLGGLFGRRA